MRWILVFMFWFVPLSAYSDLIDYQIQGHAEWLSHGDSSDITVSFSVDTESWKWESLSVELWGRTWMPTDS